MADKGGYIKLDRNILGWRWYQDANTFRVFVHLILSANWEDHDYRTTTIHRGEVLTSYPRLEEELGMSEQSIRTALNHLIETGEIERVTGKNGIKPSIYKIVGYEKYQEATGNQQGSNREVTGKQQGSNREPTGTEEREETKAMNNNNNTPPTDARARDVRAGGAAEPTLPEIQAFAATEGLSFDVEKFFHHYGATRWQRNGQTLDWRALARRWSHEDAERRAADAKSSGATASSFDPDDFFASALRNAARRSS